MSTTPSKGAVARVLARFGATLLLGPVAAIAPYVVRLTTGQPSWLVVILASGTVASLWQIGRLLDKALRHLLADALFTPVVARTTSAEEARHG